MPLSELTRIEAERLTPHIVQLWRALVPLKTVISFMNTGAHPDDEHSALLAALSLRDGIDTSYACSTRGEGGQNNLGTHTGADLGVLRTGEMERACDVLNMRMYWLSETTEDTIVDFGFSKSGEDTLSRWGRDRTIKRMVDILRLERPDIILPTFLDVPGQHGHHRAMTEVAGLAFDLAADSTYSGSDLPPWQVKKMYLPAWSGVGRAYDDTVPPPPESTRITVSDLEPVTGWSFARIGEQSRACHASQGMGAWIPAGHERDYPLHLLRTQVEEAEDCLISGLPQRLSDLPVSPCARMLHKAQSHMDAAIANFPDAPAILEQACAALTALCEAIALCPSGQAPEVLHKMLRKESQLCRLIRIASGVELRGWVTSDVIRAGGRVAIDLELREGRAQAVSVTPRLPPGWHHEDGTLYLDPDVVPSDPYPDTYFPNTPSAPCLDLTVSAHGVSARTRVPFEVSPVAVPQQSIALHQKAFVLNLATGARQINVDLSDAWQNLPDLLLQLPDGWKLDTLSGHFTLTVPEDAREGLYTLPLTSGGERVQASWLVEAGQTGPRVRFAPARLTVRLMSVVLPEARVGYIGAGNDRVAHWLSQVGADVTVLAADDLTNADSLAPFDSLIIGVFAVKMHLGLTGALPLIHDWIHSGGTLLSLYHRPWDDWNPDRVPPYRLVIGQPSLRWRVTDEAAPITELSPGHDLLTTPNRISSADWEGWHKERGLYFARSWDAAYVPLLSMSDPGEDPLLGALLAADIGTGRHVHTSLVLHYQMEKLVPGAYRLMANLIARRSQSDNRSS